MSHPLYFLCPHCKEEDTLAGSRCRNCGVPIQFQGLNLIVDGKLFTPKVYYAWLENQIRVVASGSSWKENREDLKVLRSSDPGVLYQFRRHIEFSGYRRWFRRRLEVPEKLARGRLHLLAEEARFQAENGRLWRWPLPQFTCITTDGHYFQFKLQGEPAFQIHFKQESPLKYELVFRRWLREYYARQGREPVEFQPHLRFQLPRPPGPLLVASTQSAAPTPPWERLVLRLVRLLVRLVLKPWLRLEVAGRENWHRGLPGVVIANHQSALDPFILGAYVDAEVAFLTKSSSFAHPVPRLFLRLVRGLPTTRYQIDAPVIGLVRTMLSRGQRVGIFPEGERTWSGHLRPFKLGTVRLLMALGQPIFPVYFRGAFDFWPRWRHFPRRARVRLTIGAPFCLLPGRPVAEQQAFLKAQFRENICSK
ncbi:MAG: 1-acyl-sn-glycerol-3-phosphate acyltransferase [Calditrichaeota bacterium]|nr:MAG: 1-acyl-sn-glycerol-3-phosphate acyltransferase [Calditrichota bacterium]